MEPRYYGLALLGLLVATLSYGSLAWAVRDLDIPPAMDRARIEAAVDAAESTTFDLCYERRYPKKLAKGKEAKVAKKCLKKVSKIKVQCVDDWHFKCGSASPTGFCGGLWSGGKKVKIACQREDLEALMVHEFCHVVAGYRSGHGGTLECSRR